jgi:myo-inositol catabolism protein IolC
VNDSLYVLAMDQRGWLMNELFGKEDGLTPDQVAEAAAAKKVIFEGARIALDRRGSAESLGVLVVEQLGADVAREVKKVGLKLAMPFEKSGQAVFTPEYDHPERLLEEFGVDLVKILIRHNVAEAEADRKLQIQRVDQMVGWARDHNRPLLLELLVPATAEQKSPDYDTKVRPGLTVKAIDELRDGGVLPDYWKLEGQPSVETSKAVAEACHKGGQNPQLLVLGRSAPDEQVRQWLQDAAVTGDYHGFAIGRTIWWPAIQDWLNKRLETDGAAKQIATNYLRWIEVFETASAVRMPAAAS